jgi:hypothetical protein
MASPQAEAPPSAQKRPARRAGLRQANLAAPIILIVQFALGVGVNLYVTLPAVGTPGRSSDQFFSNGPLLAIHAVLGLLLVIGAIAVLVRAIIARIATLIVTSAAGLRHCPRRGLRIRLHGQAHRWLLPWDGAGHCGGAGLLRHRPVCRARVTQRSVTADPRSQRPSWARARTTLGRPGRLAQGRYRGQGLMRRICPCPSPKPKPWLET